MPWSTRDTRFPSSISRCPTIYNQPYFLKHTEQYQTLNTLHSRDRVVVNWYNTDAEMWTHNEVHLLGDLLVDLQPDIVGLSTRCVYERHIGDILDQMKRVPGAVTVAGGHDASFRPEIYLARLDYACIGEGEHALTRLAHARDRGETPRDIPNLAYLEDGKVRVNPLCLPDDEEDAFFSEKMDRVAHFVVEKNRVQPVDFLLRELNLSNSIAEYYTMLGRGCTGMCSFCSAGQFQKLYTDSGLHLRARRMRAIDRVVQEATFAKNAGFKKIYFLDSFLLAPKTYLLAFFHAYKASGGLPFFAQLHPEQVLAHPEILDAAVRAGLDETVIGIQSGSEQINREIFNRKTPHDTICAFADLLVQRGNLKIDYHVITHNPFETEDDWAETISLLGRLPKKGTHLVLRPLYPFANTRIHRMIQEKNPPPLDLDAHYRLLMLYLFRYAFPDAVFSRIQERFDGMSMEALQKAYAEYKTIYKKDTDLVFAGMDLLNRKKYTEALGAFDSALLQNHRSYGALRGKGWAYLGLNQYAEAEDCFRKAIAQYPVGEVGVWRILGELLIRSGNIPEAAECYAKAKHLASPYHKVEYRQISLELGWAHFELGNYQQTREIYAECLDYLDGGERRQVEKLIQQIDCAAVAGRTGWCLGEPVDR